MYLVEILVTRKHREGGCVAPSVPLRTHYYINVHSAGSRARAFFVSPFRYF